MVAIPEHLRRDAFILSSLVSKDFKLKYRRSVLGILWSILNPLLMMIVMAAVFSYLLRFGDIPNYPLYLILGTVMFNYMAAATQTGMTSIIDASSLIKKIRIDKTVFPLEKVLFELVNFVVSLIAVVVVMAVFQVIPTVYVLFLPLLLVFLTLFCIGLAYLLSALAVFFRDVIHLWGVVITAWTYATPIFYPIDILAPWMQQVMAWNPMYQYITYFRDIVLYGTMPSLTQNLICLACGVVMFLIGYFVFKKTQKKFILYV